MNQIQRGMNWLADKQDEHHSVTLDYVYNSIHTGTPPPASEGISGVILPVYTDSSEDGDSSVVSRLFDFLIRVDLLTREPRRGDVIVYEGLEYEVRENPFSGAFRYSDAYRIRYRIHTQLMYAEEEE